MEGVARFRASTRLLLADHMGLGKTAQAIAAARALFATRRVRRGLEIVPASLKEQWQREWQLFTRTPVGWWTVPPRRGERPIAGSVTGS